MLQGAAGLCREFIATYCIGVYKYKSSVLPINAITIRLYTQMARLVKNTQHYSRLKYNVHFSTVKCNVFLTYPSYVFPDEVYVYHPKRLGINLILVDTNVIRWNEFGFHGSMHRVDCSK